MAEFSPITMKRKRDGASRKVTTAREQVEAAYDGFTAPAPKAPTAKKAAAKTATARNTNAGGPPAKATAAKKVAAPAAPSVK